MILKPRRFGRYVLEMLFAEGLTGAEEQNVRETPLDGRCARSQAGGDRGSVR